MKKRYWARYDLLRCPSECPTSKILAHLPSLASLSVHVAPMIFGLQDLEGLKQLTALRVDYIDPCALQGANVHLPAGSNVLLRTLTLSMGDQSWAENLECAMQLTRIDTSPDIVCTSVQWPAMMPKLQVINTPGSFSSGAISADLPDQWQNYTNLEQITIQVLQIPQLPSWLSCVQKLNCFVMPDAGFDRLHVAPLVQLPSLQIIDIGVIDSSQVEGIWTLLRHPNLGSLPLA